MEMRECLRKPVAQCQGNAMLKQPLRSSSHRVVLQNLQGKSRHKGSGGLPVAGGRKPSFFLTPCSQRTCTSRTCLWPPALLCTKGF